MHFQDMFSPLSSCQACLSMVWCQVVKQVLMCVCLHTLCWKPTDSILRCPCWVIGASDFAQLTSAPYVCAGSAMQLGACLLNFPVLFFWVCSQVTILQACEYLQRMRADMRGTNLLGALSWVYQQPMLRSYPRQVFIITDGSISNVAKVLELVRRNASAGRY